MKKATSQRQAKTATHSPNTRLGSSRDRKPKPIGKLPTKKPSQIEVSPEKENVTTDASCSKQPTQIYAWGCKLCFMYLMLI